MRWRILALLFFARVALGVQFQTMGSVGDDLIVAFGLDYAGMGLLIGLFMAPGLLLTLPAGYLGRLIADREMVVLGLGALALGGVLSSLALGGFGIGVGRALAGVGFLVTTLYFTKMVADWFDGREMATAMSILVMSWPCGIAIGQVGHAWLLSAFDWRAPFQAASVYCLVMAAAVMWFYRAPPPSLAKGEDSGRMTAREWCLILCAGGAWGIFNAAYVTYLSFGPKVLEELGHPALTAAGIISITSWIMVVSGAACGLIVDRFGRRDLVLVISMVGAILALWLLRLEEAGVGASVLFGLIGMAPAGVIMALSGQALRPNVRAFGMGIFFTLYYAAMLATPPLAGALLDATGQASAPIWLAMAMLACVVPLVLAFRVIGRGAGPVGAPDRVDLPRPHRDETQQSSGKLDCAMPCASAFPKAHQKQRAPVGPLK